MNTLKFIFSLKKKIFTLKILLFIREYATKEYFLSETSTLTLFLEIYTILFLNLSHK